MKFRKRLAPFIVVLGLALSGPVTTGCATMGFRPDLVEASTQISAQATFDAASLEYGKLLVYANSYKRQPGADPTAIVAIQQADDRVAEVRAEAQDAIAVGSPSAEVKVELVRSALDVLRSELIRYGVLKVTPGGT